MNTFTSASCKSLFLAKYNTNGTLIWFKQPQQNVSQTVALSQTISKGLTVDDQGNSYWLVYIPTGTYADGAFTNSLAGSNWYLFKYDANGNFLNGAHLDVQLTGSFISYVKLYLNSNNGYFYISSFKSSSTATAVVGGQAVNGSGFIACFNDLGQFQWKKEDSYTGAFGLRFYGLAFDSSNNIFLAGQLLGQSLNTFLGLTVPENINPPFIMKLNPTADTTYWSTYPPISSGPYNYGAIALNGSEVAFTNSCAGTNYTWGSQVLNASNISNGEGIETLFARFNSSTGACLGLHKIPGNAGFDDQGTALTVDVSGDYILGGGFGGQLTINGATLSNAGSQTDFFLAKFATSVCSPLSNEEFNLNEIKVYPNPVKDNLYWQGETSWTSYEVYSVLGKKVAEGKIFSGQNQINISHLTKGIYVLQCSDASGNVKAFKIAKE
ncbi:MAG: T9SS type A sorting domain-containing protein [Flavobacterium sp.]|nr:T9SS type A sorting domain-containing protein [Flavobacterium sp.]